MHQITTRTATSDDYEFLWQLLKATMQDYVDQTWGWDEAWQQAYFRQTFDPGENQIVVLHGQDIGVIAAKKTEHSVFLSRIYILLEHQGRGIGTQLVESVKAEAFREGLPVTLRVLKVNPARNWYERLGFVMAEERETHYYMKAMPT